ncbi:hypothetical protein FACS1894208_00110 [Clostridia bacterium]|nr:hypothetical protein FACS1894208_00110 [Clostridia bacterium]
MASKVHFIVADLGTSETRIKADGGESLRVPNNIVFLDEPTSASFPAGEGLLGSLEARIEGLEDAPVTVLLGEMAARYSAAQLRPSPLEAKYKQRVNLVSLIVGAALARIEKGNTPADLYLALPPVEVSKARETLPAVLGGEYRVEFPKLGRAARVKFDHVYCFEESRAAGLAFMEQLGDEYRNGTVLSVDIGAGTTDLALFTGGVFYERSARTYKVGGNTAREYLIEEVAAEYDFELTASDADEVVASGLLKLGNTKISVVSLVNGAKQRFAASLVEQLHQYFRAVAVPVQSVNALLVSGGGSLSSGGSESRSVASYVVDALKNVCPGVDTVEYDKDARLANLDGLCEIAKALSVSPTTNG